MDFSGVYAIYKGKEVIYIGSSENIRRRMQELLADYRSHTLHRKLLCEKLFSNFGKGTRKRLDKMYRNHLRLDFKGNIQSERFKTWASPTAWGNAGEGGRVFISNPDQIDDELIGWITQAYQMVKAQE